MRKTKVIRRRKAGTVTGGKTKRKKTTKRKTAGRVTGGKVKRKRAGRVTGGKTRRKKGGMEKQKKGGVFTVINLFRKKRGIDADFKPIVRKGPRRKKGGMVKRKKGGFQLPDISKVVQTLNQGQNTMKTISRLMRKSTGTDLPNTLTKLARQGLTKSKIANIRTSAKNVCSICDTLQKSFDGYASNAQAFARK